MESHPGELSAFENSQAPEVPETTFEEASIESPLDAMSQALYDRSRILMGQFSLGVNRMVNQILEMWNDEITNILSEYEESGTTVE